MNERFYDVLGMIFFVALIILFVAFFLCLVLQLVSVVYRSDCDIYEVVDKKAESELGEYILVLRYDVPFLWLDLKQTYEFSVSYTTYMDACVGDYYDINKLTFVEVP